MPAPAAARALTWQLSLAGLVEVAGPLGIAAFAVWSLRVLRQRSVPVQDAA